MTPDERILRILEHQKNGETDSARELLNQCGEDDPWHGVALRMLGHSLYREGQVEKSAESLRHAAEHELA